MALTFYFKNLYEKYKHIISSDTLGICKTKKKKDYKDKVVKCKEDLLNSKFFGLTVILAKQVWAELGQAQSGLGLVLKKLESNNSKVGLTKV